MVQGARREVELGQGTSPSLPGSPGHFLALYAAMIRRPGEPVAAAAARARRELPTIAAMGTKKGLPESSPKSSRPGTF